MTHLLSVLLPILLIVALSFFFWSKARSSTTRSDYLRASDEKFLSQATDPVMRQQEIARLTRTRKYLSLTGIFVFLVVGLSMYRSRMGTDTLSGWVVGLMLLLMFYDVQNKLRLLLLAERMQSRGSPDA
jgi:hypothetical protein